MTTVNLISFYLKIIIDYLKGEIDIESFSYFFIILSNII